MATGQCAELFNRIKPLKLSRGRPKFLPDELLSQALTLEGQGKTVSEISEELGFSQAQVHNSLTRQKLADTTMRFMTDHAVHGDADFVKELYMTLRTEKSWKAIGLTKQQAEIMLNQHAVESLYSATYVEDYLDSMENLPDDVMKQLTKMKEMDVHFQKYLNDLECQMKILLDSPDPKKESNSKLRLQNVLISAQDKGDEKLQIVQQVQDFVDNKVRQLEMDEKNLEFGKDLDHDSRSDKGMDHSDRPLKRARRARHEVYVPSILGPSTLEATSFSDNLHHHVTESHHHHPHQTNTKSVSTHSAATHHATHNTSSHNTSAASAVASTVVDIKQTVSAVSHSASNVPTSSHNETSGNSNKSSSNANNPVDEKSNYTVTSSVSSSATPSVNTPVSTTPKKRDQQKKEVQEKKHKRRKTKQSDNSPPNIPIDPDEPTYCLCDQVSYGEMIGCDNDLCPIEWFHFSCVQLTTKPKGKWYCPKCRGDRPNVMKPKAIFLKELEKYNREKEEKS